MATTIPAGGSVGPCGDQGSASSSAFPVGTIIDYAAATAPPGWLLCFGQWVSRAAYAQLFNAIGEAWGAGDGSTTFAVPDLRGAVCAGLDSMGGVDAGRLSAWATLGNLGGEQSHALTIAEMPSHAHSDQQLANVAGNYWTLNGGALVQNGSSNTGSSGSGQAHNNVQPTAVATKIIYAGV